MKHALGVLLTAIMGCNLLCSCGAPHNDMVELSGAVWNTTYSIKYRGDEALRELVDSVLRDVEMSLSAFNRLSTVSKINNNETARVDENFVKVFCVADSVHGISGGMFDPTISPLINVWGFGYADNAGEEPSSALIDSLLLCVGIDDCHITNGVIYKKSPCTTFNFSAIAKGYGVDCVAAMLKDHGVEDFLVEIGGEIAVSGVNAREEKWHVMIDAPNTGVAHKQLLTIGVTDCAVASSGNYRNYRTVGDKRVGHTISPVTGYPVSTNTLAATVVADNCTWADALATSCMAMRADSALTMIERLDDVEAMLAIATGDTLQIVATNGFYRLID